MADLQISCINKTNRQDAHERIRNVGGIYNNQRWKMTEDEAISAIERGQHSFFVMRPDRVKVVVAQRLGHKYLKTEPDGEQPNNLLALPECP